MPLDNLIIYQKCLLCDHTSTAYKVFTFNLSVPDGYRVVSCVCSGRIDTSSISSAEIWTKLETLISYSWTSVGIVEISLLQDSNGQRRCVDVVAVLSKN